ncbi:MAG: lysophospholipid acyltransferase family protein [Prevotellaceae bacterium]|jgi:predicted LPLAT superfamily acyltransferase|nr:lysophospholipid acyltransferase family protein [Prevotellaceae bacterium]
MDRQWQGNTDGGNFGQQALIIMFKLLSIRLLYMVTALVVPFYMLFSPKGYISIYQYFRTQFGMSPAKSFLWTYKNHFRFGQVVLDRFAVFAGKKSLFEVEMSGNEHFEQHLESKKGFVIVASHVGNFEIAGYFLSQNKKKINIIIYDGETETVRKNRSKFLNNNNIELIPVKKDMSHLFAASLALQSGEVVGMPADRLFESTKNVECKFLNGRADFPVGAFALSVAFEVDVLAVFCVKISAKKYKITVAPLCTGEQNVCKTKAEKINNLISGYIKELEQIVRQRPEQWFNFYRFWKQ